MGIFSMCPACGSDWCVGAECVKEQARKDREVLAKYDAAARKFIDKVDTGRAKSVETYNELKACLNRGEE